MIRRAMQKGKYHGFQCSITDPTISHIFFADDSLLISMASASYCLRIRDMLDLYSRASDHRINYDKSVVCFSRDMQPSKGDHLASIFGVRWVKFHERYLGRPSFSGVSKKLLFNDIKDRFWSKIKGWREKLLSVAGKQILIKSVLWSIPAYSMSLFRFPKGFVNELHKMCAHFWCGSAKVVRKIHWST
ncbi:hypothetical protein Dsin_001522 [Dipteronia sinensis]|uniref:Reverse transcriptase domain-containing protein n=1 Tax=Dipteronia sinensis TaxID=43782 RepID=A0AAE0EII8_9ROSI|nr:hypothetical protein Dsin_001522 [Dipteronia sinensis]